MIPDENLIYLAGHMGRTPAPVDPEVLDKALGSGRGKEFVERYKAKYKTMPEGSAVYGYESGLVAVEAIKRAGKKDRAAITDACLAIRDFDKGALGKWSFDANGDTTMSTLSVMKVENGDFTFVKLFRRQK